MVRSFCLKKLRKYYQWWAKTDTHGGVKEYVRSVMHKKMEDGGIRGREPEGGFAPSKRASSKGRGRLARKEVNVSFGAVQGIFKRKGTGAAWYRENFK